MYKLGNQEVVSIEFMPNTSTSGGSCTDQGNKKYIMYRIDQQRGGICTE